MKTMNNAQQAFDNNEYLASEYIITIVDGVTVFTESDELVLDMGEEGIGGA